MLSLSFFLFLFSLTLSPVLAFTFTHSAPSECDPLTIEWEGGTGPFSLLFVPVFGTPLNVSIPSTAVSAGKGSFSTPTLFPAGQKLVLTMSDSIAFATGGSTNVLTVEPSKGGSCDSSARPVDFAFQLNSALQQCRDFTFEGFTRAAQPVTISMIIPGGQAVVVRPPAGRTQHSWLANVAAGTSMIFMMTDARGAQGGASDVRIVGASDDASCINASSPSSTTSAPTSTSSTSSSSEPPSTSSSAGSTTSGTPGASGGTPISAIAGTVIGSLLFLAVIVTLGLFFLKNLKKKSDKKKQQATTDFHHSPNKPSTGAFYDSTGTASNAYTSSPQYPISPNSSAPFNNPFSDSSQSPNGNMSSADLNSHSQYPHQQQPPAFNAQRPYYPPPPLVPESQDPFNPYNPAEYSTPGAVYSTPTAENSSTALSRDPSYSQYQGSQQPASDNGTPQNTERERERRRRPSRGLSVKNPSPPDSTMPTHNASPFM